MVYQAHKTAISESRVNQFFARCYIIVIVIAVPSKNLVTLVCHFCNDYVTNLKS